MLREWNGTRGKIDEDVAVPHRHGDRVQRIVGLAEALDFFHVRRIGQRAIKSVGPCVILALNSPGELTLFILAQQRAAMTADIVERANVCLLVARDDHAGIAELPEEIIARVRDLAGASGAEPHVKVDGLHLTLEPCRISVITLRQRHSFRSGDFGTSVGIRRGHLGLF